MLEKLDYNNYLLLELVKQSWAVIKNKKKNETRSSQPKWLVVISCQSLLTAMAEQIIKLSVVYTTIDVYTILMDKII